MILSAATNCTFKCGELRWERSLNNANLFLAELEEKALEKYVLKTSVYWRFLDDIFMICEHPNKEFYQFVKILNTHYPSINVRVELGINAYFRHSSLQRKQI